MTNVHGLKNAHKKSGGRAAQLHAMYLPRGGTPEGDGGLDVQEGQMTGLMTAPRKGLPMQHAERCLVGGRGRWWKRTCGDPLVGKSVTSMPTWHVVSSFGQNGGRCWALVWQCGGADMNGWGWHDPALMDGSPTDWLRLQSRAFKKT